MVFTIEEELNGTATAARAATIEASTKEVPWQTTVTVADGTKISRLIALHGELGWLIKTTRQDLHFTSTAASETQRAISQLIARILCRL